MQYEMFAITLFLCLVVTAMLTCFILYHSYLIYQDYTTNEMAKSMAMKRFV